MGQSEALDGHIVSDITDQNIYEWVQIHMRILIE